MSLNSSTANRLERALTQRDVLRGAALLDRVDAELRVLNPRQPEALRWLFLLAQWTDLGFREAASFRAVLQRFQRMDASRLAVRDFVALQLSQAYALLSSGEMAAAARLLEAITHAHAGQLSGISAFLAWYWKGRAHRAEGQFDQALASIRRAKETAAQMPAPALVAVAQVHESWLVFHSGDKRLAFHLLDEAERTLAPTHHALSLGNIAAARGRFLRAAGDFDHALQHFEQAISLYRSQVPHHPNLARALVNAAYIKRLQALALQPSRGGRASAAAHERMLQTTREAMHLLEQAQALYAQLHHQAGTGSVLINLGHLRLESGEIDAASSIATSAYELSHRENDLVLMTRARVLQAYVEMASSEEGIASPTGSLPPATYAVEFANDALALAARTQNRRLVAAAHITRGLAATDAQQPDRDLAIRSAAQAADLLGNDERDHLASELAALQRRIAGSETHEAMLRRWLAGELDGRTFQQVEEDFAALVIPQVWMRLGRNVSRVAAELSISPKKVRRALRNAAANSPAATRPRAARRSA